MKKDIKRAIIEAAVDRGLRDIYEDPRRSIRKFVDLGRQFQKGRFIQDINNILQELLRNDDSPYYTAIEHVLRYSDRKKIKDFGINLGYNSLTVGAKTLRKIREKEQYNVPWNLIIRLDPTVKSGLTPHDLIDIVAQGKKLGIYTYTIRLFSSNIYLEDLLKLFITYDDCTFMVMLPDSEIDDSLSSYMTDCSNAMFLLPLFSDSCGRNIVLLKQYKCLYGLYTLYDENTSLNLDDSETAWDYLINDSVLIETVADENVSLETIKKTAESAKHARLEPVAPLMIFDLYGDFMDIQKLLVGETPNFFEICSDGSYKTAKGIFKANEGLPNLEKAFKKYF